MTTMTTTHPAGGFQRMAFHWLATRRIRRRFARVEHVLRARDLSLLGPELRQARSRNLDQLHAYWLKARFPRNYDHPERHTPCFIDRDGRVCAVAHLLIESGQVDLARKIVVNANDARVGQMKFPELNAWAAESGLSAEELAFIQPSYPCEFNAALYHLNGIAQGYAMLGTLAGAIGLYSVIQNVRNLVRNRVGLFAVLCGLGAGLGLLCLAVLEPDLMARMVQAAGLNALSTISPTPWDICPQLTTAQGLFSIQRATGGVNWAYLLIGGIMLSLSAAKFGTDILRRRSGKAPGNTTPAITGGAT